MAEAVFVYFLPPLTDHKPLCVHAQCMYTHLTITSDNKQRRLLRTKSGGGGGTDPLPLSCPSTGLDWQLHVSTTYSVNKPTQTETVSTTLDFSGKRL